jgi:hypothetical protein
MDERFKTTGRSNETLKPSYIESTGQNTETHERIYDKPGDIISRYGSNR